MANNSYYESQGSTYLNSSPSVTKEDLSMPEHNHDGRYYTKEQTENTQKEINLRFKKIDDINSEQDISIESKADVNHVHSEATISQSGFMSAKDKQNLDKLASKSALTNVHAYSTTVQNLAANTNTKLNFANEYIDSSDEYSISDSTFTARESGIYLVSGYFEVNNSATGNYRLILLAYKNGVEAVALGTTFSPTGGESGVSGNSAISLLAGETINLYAWSSHAVRTRARGQAYDRIQITRLW